MRGWHLAVLVAAVCLVGASAAQGAVRKVSLTSPVRAGALATLVVKVSPRARCTIAVAYGGVVSKAAGLGPKTGARITWRWRVGANTRPGRWPIVVRCGKSGTLRLLLTVSPRPVPPPPPPPLPGRKVDVGGYGLYLECAGSGSPTVVLEAGLGAPSASLDRLGVPIPGLPEGWRTLRAAVAAETRVCAYDRAGLAASDLRPSGVAPSAATYARELRTLLTNANVPGAYVFYGARFGGLLVLSHTLHWPNPSEIAGVVFSEALTPCSSVCPYDFPPEHAELGGLLDVHLGDRPVVVLTSVEGDGPEYARRSTNGIWATAPGASTYIVAEAPQLTIAALRLVVTAVRTGARLPPCNLTPLPTVGGRCQQ